MPPSAPTASTQHGGSISIRELRRAFGPVVALDNISLDIAAGEFFSLLGPSGCGKTTLLRILAGLDQPDSGELFLDKHNLLAISAHERPINTVFQSYALFPHLTVHENVAFGLRMKKRPRAEIDRRVRAMLDLAEISALATRKPHELSGGQRQRVALARALVNEPRVLLLDEPLAAVDQKLRKQLQSDLRALQQRLGLTFIYVTHDQEEALSLSDRLAVLNHGHVEQIGPPREVYDQPKTRFAAEFIGASNILPPGALALNAPPNSQIFFRPERILINQPAPENTFPAEILEITFTGPEALLKVRIGETILKIATRETTFTINQKITVTIPPDAIRLLS
jgi:spermidine/putrescine transport system ATP-binding protein